MPKKKKINLVSFQSNHIKKYIYFSAKLSVDLIFDVELLSQKKCIIFLWIGDREKMNKKGRKKGESSWRWLNC